MPALPVIAIFDVGKTNKKLLLFDKQYQVVHEQTAHFNESADEDGFPCEDLENLDDFIHNALRLIFENNEVAVKAINIAAYGASFVNIDASGTPVTPLYNYLKPYPEALQHQLYKNWGGAETFAVATASPILGSLNSGLQLYRIKQEQPERFEKIKWSLHLPQYISYRITGHCWSDITSIGCHTALWDFEKAGYHDWVKRENILPKLAPLHPTSKAIAVKIFNQDCAVGVGVHDSSAALIPYRVQFEEPFVLLSTGTWCISLNPFNNAPLTADELQQDCLCYLDYRGRPVKAARLFLGPQYDAGVVRLCAHFHQRHDHYSGVQFDAAIVTKLHQKAAWRFEKVDFADCDLTLFESDAEAYHALLLQLIRQQYYSVKRVLSEATKQIFVDGGFSKNGVYMNLLAACFPQQKVYAASMAQGTALGAAAAINDSWNENEMPSHIVQLKPYQSKLDLVL